MKLRLFSLMMACFVLELCSAAAPEKIWVTNRSYRGAVERPTQQTFTVADVTYNQVWDACEAALIRSGFEFYVSDKTSGEIRIRSIIKADIIGGAATQPTSESEFLIRLAKDSDQISVSVFCTYYWDDSLKDTTAVMGSREKSEVDRIVGLIKGRLKKYDL